MPIARFEMPDGRVARFEVPDGTSPEQASAMIQESMAQQPAQPEQSFGQRVKDELIGSMPAQVGMGALRGAASIGSTLLAPYDMAKDALAGKGLSLESNRARRASIDDGMRSMGADTDSIAYGAGKIGTEIAGTAGVGGLLAKGAGAVGMSGPVVRALSTSGMSSGATGAKGLLSRAAGGAISGGVSAGLINPEEAQTGALVGGALPVGMKLAGEAGRVGGKLLRPSVRNEDLARTAIEKYNIPLGIGDVTDNRLLQATRSILNDAPITGGMGQGAREAKQQALNSAVGQTFGAPEKKLTIDVVDKAKERLGGEFDRIWNNNSLNVDGGLISTMQSLDEVASKLPRNEGGSLSAEIKDLFSKMEFAPDGSVKIPGQVANKFQQYLRRRSESTVGLRNELNDLRQGIIQSFNASVSPEDAAALTLTRNQYKAFKTVEPILRSAELGVAGREAGDIPAALLPNAVNKSYSRLADQPLAELSQIASQFMVDRVPQTGGSARAALQNTGIGAALMGLGTVNPLLAAGVVPLAAGTQGLLSSPGVGRALLSNQPSALANGVRGTLPFLYQAAPAVSAR